MNLFNISYKNNVEDFSKVFKINDNNNNIFNGSLTNYTNSYPLINGKILCES